MKCFSKYTLATWALCFVFSVGYAQNQEIKVIQFDKLEDLMAVNGNEVKIFNFWATWCKPCIEEMPVFETISQNYRLKGVDVYLISMDFMKDLERVNTFVSKKELSSKVMLLNEPDYDSWINRVDPSWSGALPATLIVSKDGKFFFERKMELAELRQKIDSLLN